MIKLKKIISCICLSVFMIFAMAACTEYAPQQGDFELSVALTKTEFTQGEVMEYTVKLTRKSGPYFEFQGSSTLCIYYFEPIGKEPDFNTTDDIVTHKIPQNYQYEKSDRILTQYYQPGEYLFAIRFFMQNLRYDFEQVITITTK